MSALSNTPAKENTAHGGGVQNYPQSHELAPPSVAVPNSGVFSHWGFIKTTCKHCLKMTLLTLPAEGPGKGKEQRDVKQKGRSLIPRRPNFI